MWASGYTIKVEGSGISESPKQPTAMTVSDALSAPLFVVVGSTGTQGTSVIKAIEESSAAYRVRGLTRDTSKDAAKALEARGVEVAAADVLKEEELIKAFQGATYVFAMTTPDHMVSKGSYLSIVSTFHTDELM